MKLHSGRKLTITAKVAAAALSVLMILCAVFAFAGLGNATQTASATATGTTELILSTETGTGDAATSKITGKQSKAYKQLISSISAAVGGSATNYRALAKDFGTKTVQASNANLSKYKVKFGGYWWNIAYVSTTRTPSKLNTMTVDANKNAVGDAGDIVVTLYLADNGKQAGLQNDLVSKFSDLATDNTGVTYPSSMYSTSIVRASLNGTTHSKNNNTIVSETAQNAAWTRFTDVKQLGDYISTPAQIAYQQTEYTSTYQYYFPNDAYGQVSNISGHTWYNATNRNMVQIQQKTYYGDWCTDKLWLPSMSETGWDTTNVGMWGLTAAQRGNTNTASSSATSATGDTRYSWLRSGHYANASNARLLNSSGGNNYNSTNYSFAVRPALHLNLKSAASAAGVELPTQVENATYNGGSMVAALENASDYIQIADGSTVTVKQTHRAGVEPATVTTELTAGTDYKLENNIFYATKAGEYTVRFALKPTDEMPLWDETNNVRNPETGMPSRQVDGEWVDDVLYWEIPNPSDPNNPTYTIANQTVKFTIKKAAPSVTASYTDSATLYENGTLPALTHTGVAGEAVLDAEQTLTTGTKDYNWSFFPEDDLNYNDSKKGTVSLTVVKPVLASIKATFHRDQYDADTAAGKIYSSTSLTKLKTIIDSYVTIDEAKKTDGNDFEDMPAIKRDYALAFTQSGAVKLTGGEDNSVYLTFGGKQCTLTGIPVLTVDLASIRVTTRPTKTSYTALDTLDTAGMVVTATYNDGSTKAVTGYSAAYRDGHDALWYNDDSVTISYSEFNEKNVEITKECALDNLTVAKKIFDAQSVMPESEIHKPYNGEAQTVTVAGTLPDGISVRVAYYKGTQILNTEGVTDYNEGGYRVRFTFTASSDSSQPGYNYAFKDNLNQIDIALHIDKIACETEDAAFNDASSQYSDSSRAEDIKVSGTIGGVTDIAYEFYSDDAYTNKIEPENVVDRGVYYVKAIFTVDKNHTALEPWTATLTVIEHTIVEYELAYDKTSYTYTGEKIVPQVTVTVTLGGTPTVLGSDDYDVAYSYGDENCPAGSQITVTVTGKGNFSGSVEKIFTVKKAALSLTYVYNGEGKYNGTPHDATLTLANADEVRDADKSAITAETVAAIGIHYITDDGSDDRKYAGTYKPVSYDYPADAPWSNYEVTITNSEFSFTVVPDTLPDIKFPDKEITYDGKLHFIYVTVDGEETDAEAICHGEVLINYFYDTTSKKFVGRTDVSPLSDDGYPVRVEITCTTNNYEIPADIAKMTAYLKILPKTIADGDVTGVESSYVYRGADIEPDIAVSVAMTEGSEDKRVLNAGSEYSLEYDGDRLNASKDGAVVTVTVTGVGNFAGEVTRTFTITKKQLGFGWTDDDKTFTYNGSGQGVTAYLTGVEAVDASAVVPTIYYKGNTGTDYAQSTDKPVNAGNYIVIIHIDAALENYEAFADDHTTFSIGKATPTVSDPEYVSYDGGELYIGQALPEIRVGSASLNEVVTEVAGSVSWKLVDGVQPVIKENDNLYTWVFVPDDGNNFNSVEGTLSLHGNQPTFKSMTVTWVDGEQPFLWASATLEDLRQHIRVTATLTDGTDYGEVTTLYTLSGSWGSEQSPKLNGFDRTMNWDVTVTLDGLTHKFENVAYNRVVLDRIEAVAADESAGITMVYDALSKFDTDSIRVDAYYKDGSVIEGITGYTVTYQQTDERLWYGNRYVILSYNDGTADKPVEYNVSGLTVNKIVFDTSDIAFAGASLSDPYDGDAHSPALNNEDKFTIGTVAYVYSVWNGSDWVEDTSMTSVTDAGEYRIEAIFTIVDDPLIGEGVYTSNYNLDVSRKILIYTIEKIKYEGADNVASLPNSITAKFNGDTTNLYAADIMGAVTGVSADVWGIASFKYSVTPNGDALANDVAVHAGSYYVTLTFDNDANHMPIPSKTIALTVEKINPTVHPVMNGHALKETPINELSLVVAEGDTPGYFEWVSYGSFDASTYVLHSGVNTVYYKFTPDNTTDYNVLEHVQYTINARDNYALYMYATVNQGDTELFTSYTLDKLLELAADENEGLTIGVYLVFNDKTVQKIETGYEVALLSGNTLLDEGSCYLKFTYVYEEETFEYVEAYVTVHSVGLGRIEASFTQGESKIYTSGDIDKLNDMLINGDVTLTVESYYNNGDYRRPLTAEEYSLSGDWSGLTADGKYSVTVTVVGESVSTTFEIDVTLVVLTGISADFNQNGKPVYASDDIAALEKLISDGGVTLEVTALYNDSSEKTLALGAGGYGVSIATDNFAVGTTEVTVTYTEGGITQTDAFDVEVTGVLVTGLGARINDVDRKIYTDTPLEDVAALLDVTAFCNDGSQKSVTDFALAMPDGSEKLTAGTQVVVKVSYTGSDIADYFEVFDLILGVIKHETYITFGGPTAYVYDGAVHEINSGAATNHPDDEVITYEIDGAAAKVMGVKDYALVITSAERDDYYPATLTVNISVTKADYDMSGVSFADKTVVYDGTKQYVTYAGSLPMNVSVGAYTYVDGDGNECAEPSATDAGVYTVTVSFVGLDTVNYNLIPDMTATLTIEKAEVVVDESGMLGAAYTYSGAEQTVMGAVIVKSDDGAELVYAGNTFTDVPEGGVLNVVISVAEGKNYKAFEKTVEITVNKAALTLTAENYEITYGDAPANGGVASDGFVDGEGLDDLDGELVYGYDYSQYGNAGSYVITIGGVSSDNYDITLVSGTLTVKKAEAEVEWTVGDYVYDGLVHAPTAAFTDLFGTKIGLTVVVSGTNGGVVKEPVGAGDYVAAATTTNPNYVLSNTEQSYSIIAATDYFVRFDFRKDYTVTYGSVPETAEELAALAELLINQSYVRAYYNGNIADLDHLIKLMTVRLEVESGTPVTSATAVGRYNICFEFKSEFAEEYAGYAVYQTVENSENTNLGRLIIERRALTVDWGNTEFKSDGTAHLLTAKVYGFIDGETPVEFTMTEKGGEFDFDIDGVKVKFSLTVDGDLISVGGHEVTVTIDDGNYVVANAHTTVSVREATGLSTLSWALIGVAAVMAFIAIIAIIVAAKRKKSIAAYDGDGFNDPYYEDETT